MDKKMKNIPKLRFPEFVDSGEWEEKKLEEICKFQQGVQVDLELQLREPKDDFVRFIRIENYTQKSNDFRYIPLELSSNKFITKDEIAIVRYGATAGYIGRGLDGVLANNLFKLILNKEILNTNYLFHFLNREQTFKFFQAEMAGGAMPALSFGIVGFLKMPFTSIQEQQKIADCLSSVDSLISAQSKKVELLKEHKKGLLQNLFPTDGESVPRLRFPEFANDGEWEEKKLGEIATKNNFKNKNLEFGNVLTNSAVDGIVNQRDYFDKDIANKNNLSGYYVVNKNDFIYNPRISSHAEVGSLKRNNLEKGIMSPLYMVFKFKEGNLSFFEHFFETKHWHNYMKSIANTGVKFDRLNIGNEQFFNLPIPFPLSKEQQKIADCLSSVDEQISQQTSKLQALKEHKKGLMQQLFPFKEVD